MFGGSVWRQCSLGASPCATPMGTMLISQKRKETAGAVAVGGSDVVVEAGEAAEAVVGGVAFAAAYSVLWSQVWGRWAFSPIVGFAVGTIGMNIITG